MVRARIKTPYVGVGQYSSLEDESTEPVEESGLRKVLVRVPQLDTALQKYLEELPFSVLKEGGAYVTRFYYDSNMGMPRVWIEAQTLYVLDADLEGAVAREIDVFAERIERYFPGKFAVSAHLLRKYP